MSGGSSVSGPDQKTEVTDEDSSEPGQSHFTADEQVADFFQNASVPMHLVGPDGTVLHANQAELDALGYTREEYIGHHIAEFHADQSVIDDILERLRAGEEVQNYEARMQCKDGSIRYVLINASVNRADGEFINTRCITRDITERKREEQRQARRYEAIFNQTYQFSGLMEPDGTVIEANRTALEVGGIDPEDVLGKPFWETYWWQTDEDTRQELQEAIERAADGEFVRYEVEVQGEQEDILIDFSIRPITDDQGDVEFLIPEGRRITELKKSRWLNFALDATSTGVWEWNLDTNEVTWSESLERMLDIEPGSFAGTFEAHAEYLHPADVSVLEEATDAALKGDGVFEAEFRMQPAAGQPIWVESHGELFDDEEPERIIGIVTDITDRKDTERSLARRELLDPSVELEFQSAQFAQTVHKVIAGGLEFSLEGVVPQSDGTQLIYGTVAEATADEFETAVRALPSVGESRLLATDADSARFEISTEPGSITTVFTRFDGELQSISIEDETGNFVGEFPETVEPEAVAEAVRDTYPDMQLASQRRIMKPAFVREIMQDVLTERQRTVLEMAYYSGYFNQPRDHTGGELAERLGITRQAFNVHLRKAQARVFEATYAEPVDLPD